MSKSACGVGLNIANCVNSLAKKGMPRSETVTRVPPPARGIQPPTRPNAMPRSWSPQYHPPSRAVTSSFIPNSLHQ